MTKKNALYKNILVALDLTEHSNSIMKRAVQIASHAKSKLNIAHVLAHTPIPYAGEFSIPIDVEAENIIRKQATKRLAQLGKKYQIESDAQYLLEGSVKTEVTNLAKKIHADLIVVGTHGHTGIEALLGSEANAILHAAKCDVWVIRIT